MASASTADDELAPALEKTNSHDMAKIKGAYKAGDIQASKAAHAAGTAEADVHSGAKSEYIKSMVFGGLDGIITTFAVVSAGAGAELEARVVILLGCANLISDGISMGLGDYFSEKAEAEGEEAEKERLIDTLTKHPAGALKEVAAHFVRKKGFSQPDASHMLSRYAKYTDEFADLIMAEDDSKLEHVIGLLADLPAEDAAGSGAAGGEEEEDDPDEIWKQGMVTMVSFWCFGSIPVIAFAIASALGANKQTTFVVDIIITVLTLASLGVTQARITGESMSKKAVQMIINGALACIAGYLIAWFLAFTVGEGDACGGATCRPPFMDQYRFNDAPWLGWDSPVPAPDAGDSQNWACSSHAWGDVTHDDVEHIFHMRTDLFAGESGHFEVAGKAGHLPELEMKVGETYLFDQTHHTNWMHPIGFAYFADGHHGQTWGGTPRKVIADFSALKYQTNNAKSKRVENPEIMEYDTAAYDSAFRHLKSDWLQSKYGAKLTVTDEIAAEAAKNGGIIYYYSRFHSKTSGKIRLVGSGYQPSGSEAPLDQPSVGDAFDTLCGTYDTSPYRPELGVCTTQGNLLCDELDTPFEDCMAALNCKMKTEMQVGAATATPTTTFLQQMIPHHANAINMARVLLKTVDLSGEPFVEGLMYDIINGQTDQVNGMRARLGQLGQLLPEDVSCNDLPAIYAAANMTVPYSMTR